MKRLITNLRRPHAASVRCILNFTLALVATAFLGADDGQIVSAQGLTQKTGQATAQTPGATGASSQTRPRTPTETVREFYKSLRERKFREAFSLSIYKAAIEPL